MSFAENLDPFFADFGVTATVGGSVCVGLFDNAYAASLGFTAGTAPVLIVQAADVPSVAQGDVVVVNAASYIVAAVEPDGFGLLVLRLQEA